MKTKSIILGSVFALALGATSVFGAQPSSPPGQDPCSHGNSQASCRPDPQPSHGKDCLPHGNNGGVNEDHCASPSPSATPVATPTPTPVATPTPTATPTINPTPTPTPVVVINPTPTPVSTPTPTGELLPPQITAPPTDVK